MHVLHDRRLQRRVAAGQVGGPAKAQLRPGFDVEAHGDDRLQGRRLGGARPRRRRRDEGERDGARRAHDLHGVVDRRVAGNGDQLHAAAQARGVPRGRGVGLDGGEDEHARALHLSVGPH